jgi:hypothetical protein
MGCFKWGHSFITLNQVCVAILVLASVLLMIGSRNYWIDIVLVVILRLLLRFKR